MLQQLWRSLWLWLTEPVPFPRDHWYRPRVRILWEELDREEMDGSRLEGLGDPATPESRAEEPVDSRSPPPS